MTDTAPCRECGHPFLTEHLDLWEGFCETCYVDMVEAADLAEDYK